jgi:hypothetical protein
MYIRKRKTKRRFFLLTVIELLKRHSSQFSEHWTSEQAMSKEEGAAITARLGRLTLFGRFRHYISKPRNR